MIVRAALWGIAMLVLAMPTFAADPAYCRTYADAFAAQFKAVVDREINPYFHERAWSRCVNADDPPQLAKIGTVPATGPAAGATVAADVPVSAQPPADVSDAWKARCRAHYRTWDEATGTVIRYHSHRRVPCPVRR